MSYLSQHNAKTVNLFVPYYSCGDKARQEELDLCLQNNIENTFIDQIFLMVDDQTEPPVDDPKMEVIDFDTRPTYRSWIEETQKRKLKGVSLLANSDIHFDQTIACLDQVFASRGTFLSLSRWEKSGDHLVPHPNPHWSQDVWGIACGDDISLELKECLNFGMGIPRCDNKIAYLFAVRGWKMSNPYLHLKSIHIHDSEIRSYDKKLDTRIVGGVAYVHPSEQISDEADVEIDIWTVKSDAIQSVNLNTRLESWQQESQFKLSFKQSTNYQVTMASSEDMLNAIYGGECIFKNGHEYEVLKSEGTYYFKNQNEILNTRKINFPDSAAGDQSLDKVLATGFIPSVITTHSILLRNRAKEPNDLNFWQYPCATEKQAYENHLKLSEDRFIDYENCVINTYLPLPWATYIDKAKCPEDLIKHLKILISDYKRFAKTSGFQLRVHTVCQHIHWHKIIDSIEEVGVTELHLSHKCSHSTKIRQNCSSDLRIHCWPLIAVNYVTPERNDGLDRKPLAERSILASFIGAQMAHYRNGSRIELVDAANAYGKDNVHIELRDLWHYNHIVYDEQVKNTVIDKNRSISEIESTRNYNRILSKSIFSLCPEGAGTKYFKILGINGCWKYSCHIFKRCGYI